MTEINRKRRLPMLLLFCGLLTGTGLHAGDIPVRDTTKPAPDFGMRLRALPEPPSQIREPVIIRKAPTNEATLVKHSSGAIRVFHINRPGKADRMMMVTSLDDGKTWSEPEVAFELPGEAYYANQFVEDTRGTLHCVFHIFRPGRLGYRGRQLDLWYTSLQPGGKWAPPRMIWEGYVGSLRGFIQLKNGTLLIPMSESDTARASRPPKGETDHGLFQVISLYSTDNGTHWKKSENHLKIAVDPDQVSRYGAVEPNTIELADGRIWMLIRTNKGHLYESYSHDSGKTWSEAEKTAFISSDSPAGLLRLANGNIILFVNGDQRHDDDRSYANGGREALQAAISTDETKTWQGFREVLVSPAAKPPVRGDRGTAYPSAVETKSGKVLFVSGQGEESAVAIFDPAWLQETTQTYDPSRGPVQWTFHGSDGRAGVWNFPMTKKGSVSMNIEIQTSCEWIDIALSDHFSAALDTMASYTAPLSISLHRSDIKGDRAEIRMEWDVVRKRLRATLNGRKIGASSIRYRPTPAGFNHLRTGIAKDSHGMDGFRITGIQMKTSR
jgi:hypothetical protein